MKKKKKVLTILAVLAILVTVGVVYTIMSRSKADDTSGEPTLYQYSVEDPFVTNVKDSQKLFKTTVILVTDEEGMDEFLAENQYVIRDSILFIMRSLTEEDIESEDIQDVLRESIPVALNSALGIDSIVSIYFSDFVMQ
jgi:flagellar basal body-associated protein FliL